MISRFQKTVWASVLLGLAFSGCGAPSTSSTQSSVPTAMTGGTKDGGGGKGVLCGGHLRTLDLYEAEEATSIQA